MMMYSEVNNLSHLSLFLISGSPFIKFYLSIQSDHFEANKGHSHIMSSLSMHYCRCTTINAKMEN